MMKPSRREVLRAGGAMLIAGAVGRGRGTDALAQQAPAAGQSGWSFRSAKDLAAALKKREVSAVELLDQVIARVEALDGRLNAVVVRDFERAPAAAKAADVALGRGEARALTGIPMAIKESFNVAGLPTTWGIPRFKDFIAEEDALIVSRVKAAGAVIFGKTNVPIVLGDWQSYNDIYGTTNNPWDLGRTPGGSSGGSAAALAAGFGPLSLGSDIGGSLRAPAHYCGVYAHKPTWGLVPARGHTPPGFKPLAREVDLAVVGPMARSAADLVLAMDVIAGPDEVRAGIGYRLALPAPRHDALKDFRVLVIDEHPLLPTASVIKSALGRLSERLGKAGVKVGRSEPVLPDLADSARLYMRLLLAVLAANWPLELYRRSQTVAEGLAADDKSLTAERSRGAVLSHREWLGADVARSRLQARW